MADVRPWDALRRALDDSPASVLIMSGADHVFEYTNAAYVATFGARSLGSSVRDNFPELDGQGFYEMLDRVYAGGDTIRLDEVQVFQVKPGATEPAEIWLTFTYSPWHDHSGAVAGVVCTAVDVTSAVRAQAKASQTEELASVLADEAEVASGAASRLQEVTADVTQALGVGDVLETVLAAGVQALGADSAHVVLVNESARVLRVAELATPTRPLVDVLDLDAEGPLAATVRTGEPLFLSSVNEIRAAFPGEAVRRNLAESGEQALVVVPLSAGDHVLGALRFGMTQPGLQPAPVRSFMVSLANHCAIAVERSKLAASAARAMGELQLSEDRYRTLVEAISLDVWRADPSGALVTDMPAWRQLTGGEDDLRGEGWLADVHPDDKARVLSSWQRAVRQASVYDTEYRIRGRDGWRRIRSRGAPLLSDSGQVLEWIGTTDDVSAEHLAVDRALALQRIAEALVGAATVADVEDVVLGLVRETVQARALVLGLLDAETGAIPLRSAGYPDDFGIEDAGARRLPLLTDVIRTGRARFIPHAGALYAALTDVAGAAGAQALYDTVTGAGDLAWCMLPLISHGTPSGGITLGFPQAHDFDPAERTFLLTIAANCAVALQRAQLFEQQRTTATVLQRALQPSTVEQPGFGMAWIEQRTAAGSDVGGDWAEVLPLGPTSAAIVLGDVMGRGVRAARMMAETRAAVRTLATLDPDPQFVFDGLDRIFASHGLDEIVTLFYGVLCIDGSLRCISAGHLPPLVVPRSGDASFLDVPATPPLGVPGGVRAVHETSIASGDAIVLYSDGLVESRLRSLGDGLDTLRSTAHDVVGGDTAAHPRLLCTHLIEHLLVGGESDDDVTLLALLLD